MVEAKRLYVVGGEPKVQDIQFKSFISKGLHVVEMDKPTELPLSGFSNAIEKRANIAVVNFGLEEVASSGLRGADIVRFVRIGIPGISIVTFSLDSGSDEHPDVQAHVQRTFQIGSYIRLANLISGLSKKQIDISPNSEFL